ncbi:MAG: hypothetical protein C4536_04140 [Actinobacteria bacterium]|nr:MAG: hypothetical protein C4536_04140 [Actinomycetota bacterium]
MLPSRLLVSCPVINSTSSPSPSTPRL